MQPHSKRQKTWIPRIARAAALVAVYAPIACVNSNQEGVETTKAALGTFNTWQNLATPKGQDGAPTIAQVNDTQIAFSASGPLGASALTVFWTSRTVGGNWSPWLGLVSSTADFKERPAAVAFDVPTTSPLAGTIALVGRKTNNTYYVRIQSAACSTCIVQSWHPIGGIWTTPPAVAFIPANATTGPRNTLVVVGRGLNSRYWYMQNTLTAQNGYSPSNWTSPIQAFGPQTFDSAPAMTYAADTPNMSLIVAGITGSTMLFNSNNGVYFQSWQTSDGAFLSGPAPALAAGHFGSSGTSARSPPTAWGRTV